jgi:hypothetical protein
VVSPAGVDQATLDAILASLTGTPIAAPAPAVEPVADPGIGCACHPRRVCDAHRDRWPNGAPACTGWALGEPCKEPLSPLLWAAGRHYACDPPPSEQLDVLTDLVAPTAPVVPTPEPEPEAPTGPPPSTLDELHPVLIGYDISRPRSMQLALGPSELGTPCQQQMARKLVGAPKRPITEPLWAPWQGTQMHRGMEDVIAYWNTQLGRERWLAEDRLEIEAPIGDADGIAGSGDAFDVDHAMVVDWKYTGTTALNKLRAAIRAGKSPREQVSQEYRVQTHLYGRGHERKGRPVRWVRLVLLARSWQYRDSAEWTEAYNPDLAIWAVDRYWQTVDLVAALGLPANRDAITAVPASPSKDACAWCPFRRPGQPSSWDGCAGDAAATARAEARFIDGLVTP